MERFKGKEDHSTEGAYCSTCNVLFTTKGEREDQDPSHVFFFFIFL